MENIPDGVESQFYELFVDLASRQSQDNQQLRIDSGLTLLRKECLTSRLRYYDSRIRCLAWRSFLGLLPQTGANINETMSAWSAAALTWRQKYEACKKEAHVDPRGEQVSDPLLHNPLSDAEDSPWNQYWRDEELKNEIRRDIVRTYPELEYFQQQDVQDLMLRVLFVFAKLSPLGYKQGMHELLAPVILVLHRERELHATRQQPTDATPPIVLDSIFDTIFDSKYLEHDAYALLDQILLRAGEWFASSPSGASQTPSSPLSNVVSPVVKRCRYIQDALLLKFDPQLHGHLTGISIEPQLYLLRWLRLLFGREFHVEDALVVWDAIFAFDDKFGLVDFIATAMLMFIRSQLIGKDYSSCIRRLLKFPPLEDVAVVVEHALALTKPKPPPGSESVSPAAPRPTASSPKSDTPAKPSPAHGHANVMGGSRSAPPAPTLEDRVKELEHRNAILGERLQKTVEILQSEIQRPDLNPLVSDVLILAIAELKRTKDLALGFLPVEEMEEPDIKPTTQLEPLPRQLDSRGATMSVVTYSPEPRTAPEPIKIGSDGVLDEIFG